MTTLLKNGKIYDGTGAPAFIADILIDGERIVKAAPDITDTADSEIDLKGKSVSSGFIDIHSHNDWFAIKKDPMRYFEPFIRQGVTSFVTGNCGLSAIGFEEGTVHIDKIGGGLFGYKDDMTGVYPNAAAFFDAIGRSGTPCNIAALAGHCSARASVSGYENRKLTADEEERMLSILEDNLKNGAAGVSLGLMYNPGVFAGTEELRKVAHLCVKYDKPLTVHARAESKVSMSYPQLFGRSHLLRALDELVEISKGTNLKLQYSHAIFVGRKSFGDVGEFLRIINKMREEGVRVQFDIYNELQGVSVITVILPAWYRGMSEAERSKPLNKLKLDILIRATVRLLGFGFDDIEIAYIGPGYEHYEGRSVHQLAKQYGKSDLDMYLQLCKESNFNGRVNMGPYTTDEIIHSFEKNELCLYMTDAWVEEHGVQNPALYDNYPKFLRDSLSGLGDTMPNTIRRMTGAGADRFMLRDRGYIKEGFFADITVFDEDELLAGTPGIGKPFGIDMVFINGKKILDGGEIDYTSARHSGSAMPV